MDIEALSPADIERRSMEIIESELGDSSRFSEGERLVVKRVIHATADFDYADNLRFSENALEIGLNALKSGAVQGANHERQHALHHRRGQKGRKHSSCGDMQRTPVPAIRKEMNMNGKLFGIGTGPGDPQLMTLKAVHIINDCDVIAAPRTSGKNTAALDIASQVCDMSRKEIIYMDFTMGGADADELHKKAADNICKALSEGKNVAFLTIGDITVYSTFSYIAEIVERRGHETELCPGVTSFCAAAAAAKRSLTEKDSPLVVIPSSCGDIDSLLDIRGTRVIMKSGRKIAGVKKLLAEKGMTASTYAVCNCGLCFLCGEKGRRR